MFVNSFEQRSKASYDKKAAGYDSTFDGRFTAKFKRMLLDTVSIRQGDKVADIACGNGRLLNQMSQKASFCGYGADISDKMISEAKKQNPDMSFFTAGCDKLPFENGEIDVMTVCAAYHHFPSVRRFAKEARRVMKKGGRLYIAEVYLPDILRTLINPFVILSKAGDVRFYSPNEIASLFKRYGFKTCAVRIDGIVQIIELKKCS